MLIQTVRQELPYHRGMLFQLLFLISHQFVHTRFERGGFISKLFPSENRNGDYWRRTFKFQKSDRHRRRIFCLITPVLVIYLNFSFFWISDLNSYQKILHDWKHRMRKHYILLKGKWILTLYNIYRMFCLSPFIQTKIIL